MTTIINGSSPSITFSDGSAQTSATRPFLNRIINGAMVVNQRALGTTTINSGSAWVYTLDRWSAIGETSLGVYTLQQSSTAPNGFINSLLATVTTASTPSSGNLYVIRQVIEGLNCTDLGWGTANAKTVTLSFWVRSSLTGTFGGVLKNSAENRSYPFTYTINSANTWEYETITIAGDTSGTWLTTNGAGINLLFSLGAGSSVAGTSGAWAGSNFYGATGQTNVIATNGATFYITGCQLEVGSTATSFDYRPYGTELALCQRYYYQATGASGNGYEGFATGVADASTSADVIAQMPVTMRAIPTTSFAGTIYVYDGGVTPTLSSVANVFGGKNGVYLNLTTASGLTIGRGVMCYTNNATTNNFAFSAEL